MPIIRLTIKQSSPIDRINREASDFLLANLRTSYFPGRGVPFSLLIHVLIFCILFFFRVPKDILDRARVPEGVTVIEQNEPKVVMYLPLIGGGDLGMIFPAPKIPNPAQHPPVASASKPKGLSYPGRQEIISDPPEPTNKIQTLEQPALVDPPILPPPLALPNIVQIAEARIEPMPELPPQPEEVPEQVKPVEPPPSRPPSQIKPAEPPPVKPPPAPKPVEPPMAEPPKEEKPVEPQPVKPPQPLKPPEPPAPIEPTPIPPPVIDPEAPVVAPMALPFPVKPQVSVEAPKVVLPPLVPPKPEKPPDPVPKPEPPPKKETPKEPARASAESPKSKPVGPAAEKPKETPPATQDSTAQDQGSDQRALLALTPMPAPLQKALVVPKGEARGRFAISPDPNLAAAEMTLGSKSGDTDAETVVANRSNAPPTVGVPQSAPTPAAIDIGPVSGFAKNKDAVGTDTKKSNPKRKEVPGITGTGTGSNKSGNTKGGPNSGRGVGTGAGSGSGPGKKKPFSGITIVGGAYDPGGVAEAAPVVQARRPMQTAYGVTIISTENSGGGLPNMGVFSGEQIYTVYLDMRRDESDPTPSWTLEFAAIRDASHPENASGNIVRGQEGLILPFPIDKDPPSWPTELIAKYRGLRIIVYAIIDIEGKMTSITVKDSPDILLNEPLLRTLSKWIFRPAQFQGSPIAVKALMGIPLWLPE